MTLSKRLTYIALGPVLLAVSLFLLTDSLDSKGAQAVGLTMWMIFWWITRPVHISITALLPVIVNALLDIIPMHLLTAQYVAESIILIFGSGLLCAPWASIGLDRRIALKTLSLVGSSMRSQVIVWLLASVLFTTLLPNVMVCAVFTPIAIAMLSAAGYTDIKTAKPAVPILLCIGWGVSLGGAGTPLGGAMNLTAISFLEAQTGQEFFYIDWIVRVAPYFILATLLLLAVMLYISSDVKSLNGTKEYFTKAYKELGAMKRDEKISLVLFFSATFASFLRPLYADLLPGLSPAYIFLLFGSLSFFVITKDKKFLLTWETAQSQTMWGMMILFASGLALGVLLTQSGATAHFADMVVAMNLDGGFTTIVIIVVITRILAELTNGTTAAAMVIPVVLEFTTQMGLDPMPYWFVTVMAFNLEFLLPISVRAIPISYGLDADIMFKKGILPFFTSMIFVIIFGYITITLWPTFYSLPHLIF